MLVSFFNHSFSLAFFITMSMLACLPLQTNWQGYGNMSAQNLTTLWGYFDSNIGATLMALNNASGNVGKVKTAYDEFNTGLSDYLNDQWSPAWNVFFFKNPAGKDAIVYGYAFRNHWMWLNGYQANGSSSSYTLIVWKDYNCKVWMSISTYSSAQGSLANVITAVNSINSTYKSTDIWAAAKELIDNYQAAQLGDMAFSIVANQNSNFFSFPMFGRMCMAGTNLYYYSNSNSLIDSSKSWGSYIIFQTR